ncbi:MAG: hypothetical protein RhofKO_33080 [Rhodothermales bacterium]
MSHSRVLHTTAQTLNYVVSPLLLPPIVLGVLMAYFEAPPSETWWVIGVAFVVLGILPLLYLLLLVKHSRVRSIEVRDRRERFRPFLVGLGFYVLAMALLSATMSTGRSLVLAVIAGMILNAIIVLVITLWWKISVHLTSLGGSVAVLGFLSTTPWSSTSHTSLVVISLWVGVLLLPMLAWARVQVGAHTWPQTVAGALLGLSVPWLFLMGLHRWGVFSGL